MLRAQGVASGKRLRLRVARMPEGEDPADLLAGGDKTAAARFREAIDAAEDLPSFHVRTLLDDADLNSPGGRDRALDEVVQVIAAMPDSITREELMREVADRLDADPGLVARRVSGAGRGGAARAPRGETPPAGDPGAGEGAAAPAPRQLSARERRELAFLAMCVAAPPEGQPFLERVSADHFSLPVAGRAHGWLLEHLDDPMKGLGHEDEELLAYVTQVVMQSEREPASRESIEINFLELERGLVERRRRADRRIDAGVRFQGEGLDPLGIDRGQRQGAGLAPLEAEAPEAGRRQDEMRPTSSDRLDDPARRGIETLDPERQDAAGLVIEHDGTPGADLRDGALDRHQVALGRKAQDQTHGIRIP
jgi:hypothetical protein